MTNDPIAERAGNEYKRLETAVDHTLDVAHSMADDAATEISERARQLREQAANVNAKVTRVASEALEQATEYTRAGIDQARGAAAQLSDEVRSLSARAITHVRAEPVTSMLVAAASGAALVMVLRLLFGSRAHH